MDKLKKFIVFITTYLFVLHKTLHSNASAGSK